MLETIVGLVISEWHASPSQKKQKTKKQSSPRFHTIPYSCSSPLIFCLLLLSSLLLLPSSSSPCMHVEGTEDMNTALSMYFICFSESMYTL